MFAVAVCGLSGSGKSTTAKLIANRVGERVSVSDVIRDYCRRVGLSVDRKTLQSTGEVLARENNGRAFAEMLYFKATPDKVPIFDGIRLIETIEGLKGFYSRVFIVYVDVEPHILNMRLIQRGDAVNNTLAALMLVPIEAAASKIADIADVVISNNSGMSDLDHLIEIVILPKINNLLDKR
ncbi:hypothetical protein CHU95_17615 [Niveispirillum lacus]|uniref:Dephospho-CoA kinase n=1 Tax=Niveispirillum lacus TaxID=1981099 RepID=A0A255YTN9_9PROT|nr:AAA family ATPase [Niveispirillum lacus]OYQ32597.1 hypothetical protein CHU95_17615 [Niveispirillum lacus]